MTSTGDSGFAPSDIAQQEFPTAFRGYDQSAVKDYLRRLSFFLEHDGLPETDKGVENALEVENKDLKRQLRKLKRQLETSNAVTEGDDQKEFELLGNETARVLETARSAAKDIIKRAEAQAARLEKESEAEASAVRAEAAELLTVRKTEAERVISEARTQADERSARRVAEAENHYKKLSGEANKVLSEAENRSELQRVATESESREIVSAAERRREEILTDLVGRRAEAHKQLTQLAAARSALVRSLQSTQQELNTLLEALNQKIDLNLSEREAVTVESKYDEVSALLAELDVDRPRRPQSSSAATPNPDPTKKSKKSTVSSSDDTDLVELRLDDLPSISGLVDSVEDEKSQKSADALDEDSVDETVELDLVKEGLVTEGLVKEGLATDGLVAAPSGASGSTTIQKDGASSEQVTAEPQKPAKVSVQRGLPNSKPNKKSGSDSSKGRRSKSARKKKAGPAAAAVTSDVPNIEVLDDGAEEIEVIADTETRSPAESDRSESLPAAPDVDAEGGEDSSVFAYDETPVEDDDLSKEIPLIAFSETLSARSCGDTEFEEEFDGELAGEFVARDVAITRFGPSMRRSLRRALNDDQSDVLNRLQASGQGRQKKVTPNDLPDLSDQLQNYVAPLEAGLSDLASAGVVAGDGETAPAEALHHMALQVAKHMVQSLRTPTIKLVEESDGGDREALHEPIRDLYRSVRSNVLDSVIEDAINEAFSLGLYSGLPSGQDLVWALDPRCEPAALCEINAAATGTQKTEPFPSGHTRPLAMPGCRCLVLLQPNSDG